MSRAFGNRTADLTSSQYLNFKKSKVNYNYLRLLSEFNIEECDNIIFSDYNGNSSLKKINKMEGDGNDAVKVYSKLIATDSYDLKQSINRGFYLPTFINSNGNIVVNRAPFSFDPLCKKLPDKYPWQNSINSSGDLQEILQYEYLDFGTQTILTNIDFVSFYKQQTHPGGSHPLQNRAEGSIDSAPDFKFHSKKTRKLWNNYLIGYVKEV